MSQLAQISPRSTPAPDETARMDSVLRPAPDRLGAGDGLVARLPSLGSFYLTDRRRARSREHDLGLWWRSSSWNGPTFRAAWVLDTGELYLMQHEGLPGGGVISVFALGVSLDELLDALDGWETVCGERGSIDWLLDRLRATRRDARPSTSTAAPTVVAA